MNDKKVTIQDIAQKLNISKSTVSKALSNATDVNEQTRERILSCASELGYYVKVDRTPKQKNVIVFIYGIFYGNVDQFGYEIILGIQAMASEQNYGVNIVTVTDEELQTGKYYNIMSSGNYEGSFFLGFKPHPLFIEHINKMNLPIVVLDNDFDSPLVARIGCDNHYGICHIVRYLYEKGHRKIGFLGGEADSIVTKERENAYKMTLEELSLEYNENYIRYGHFSGKDTKKHALNLVKSGITAIVCVSDILACTAIQALSTEGYNVPDDISITGYDDLPSARYSHPPLTTMRQNRIHIGKTAFFILSQMKNGIQVMSVALRPELVERASVKDINNYNTTE